jgi:hypothetical protein
MCFAMKQIQICINEQGIKPCEKSKYMAAIFNSKNYKIYVLKKKDSFVYIGKTKQAIGTKFSQGFRSYLNNKNNNRQYYYGGYKWIEPNMNKELHLFVFDLGFANDNEKAEVIEAEIVYLIREKYGKWPVNQNEIHFNNNYQKAITLAGQIFNSIDKK